MTRPDVWENRLRAIPDADFAKAAEVVKANFNLSKIVDPEAYATIIAEAMITARAEQREEDARILLDYPPDEFFEILWNMTTRDDEGDPFWKLQGDTGNWAAHMIKLLAPYAAAIRNGGK